MNRLIKALSNTHCSVFLLEKTDWLPDKSEEGADWMSGAQNLAVFRRGSLNSRKDISLDFSAWEKLSPTCWTQHGQHINKARATIWRVYIPNAFALTVCVPGLDPWVGCESRENPDTTLVLRWTTGSIGTAQLNLRKHLYLKQNKKMDS